MTDAARFPDVLAFSEEHGHPVLTLRPRGGVPVRLEEGYRTGDMTEGGLSVGVPYSGHFSDGFAGGCISRAETVALRDWLSGIIAGWADGDPVRWNPWNKVVQDHRDGTVDWARTEEERAKRGLGEWTPSEPFHPPVY